MGVGGGGGKRQRCKNPVAERKLDGSSLVPNTTKMQVGEGELHSEKRHPDYRNEPPNPRLKKSKNNKRARTLRATPIKGSKEIHHTFAFVQYHVQFYGQTLGLKRAGPGGISFDVEFEDHQQAWDAYRKCEIPGMSLDWAQINAMDKMAPVPAVASFRPPRFDYPHGSKEPSLPVPWNNPFCTEWDEPPEPIVSDPSKSTRPRRITTNPRHLSSVLWLPADPRQPSKIRYWPLFPRQRR